MAAPLPAQGVSSTPYGVRIIRVGALPSAGRKTLAASSTPSRIGMCAFSKTWFMGVPISQGGRATATWTDPRREVAPGVRVLLRSPASGGGHPLQGQRRVGEPSLCLDTIDPITRVEDVV